MVRPPKALFQSVQNTFNGQHRQQVGGIDTYLFFLEETPLLCRTNNIGLSGRPVASFGCPHRPDSSAKQLRSSSLLCNSTLASIVLLEK